MTHHSKFFADLTAKYDATIPNNDMLLLWRIGKMVGRDDEVCLDVMLSQILMSLWSISILHVVVSI